MQLHRLETTTLKLYIIIHMNIAVLQCNKLSKYFIVLMLPTDSNRGNLLLSQNLGQKPSVSA